MTSEGLARLMEGAELLGVDDVLERPAWHAQAACIGSTVDFYPTRGEPTAPARQVCAGCPVVAECLEYALAHTDRFGVWGGKSERERRAIRAAGYDPEPIVRRCEVCHDVATPQDPAARVLCRSCRIDEHNRGRDRGTADTSTSTKADEVLFTGATPSAA